MARLRRWWRIMRAHGWLIRTIGAIDAATYMRTQAEREREKREGFDAATHVERMLAAYGRLDLLDEARRRGFC